MSVLLWRLGGGLLLLAVAFSFGWGLGWKGEHRRFAEFKAQVEAQGREAQAHAQETMQKQKETSDEVAQYYEDRLAALQKRLTVYPGSRGVRQPDSPSGAVSRVSEPPARIDEGTPNLELGAGRLAPQCAETTLMLLHLQEWVREQGEIQ